MWAITNYTPYRAGKTWGRTKDGLNEWIVAVKGTFDIGPDGRLRLADEPADPLLIGEYVGEPGVSSLRYEADLVAPKPTTDVILNATAYAPRGRPSTDFRVAMTVGPIHKELRVRGHRHWSEGLLKERPSDPEPITEVPIVYERAWGGYDHADPDPRHHCIDVRNPVGCGVSSPTRSRAGQRVPNFEYPDGTPEKSGPAGFGPIDAHWSPRREWGGTYDDAWMRARRPLLPEDWDPRSLQCAPVDQQSPAPLRGGEMVELVNLTPGGALSFQLPKVYLTFSTKIDRRTEEHRSQLATVIIEPDRPRVLMVWVTSLPCRNDVDYLDRTIIREKRYI